MAEVAGHLSLAELQAGYRDSKAATLARHYQVIWLLAQGRSCAEVAQLTSLARRWVEQLLARYNQVGPASLGDRRRGQGAKAASPPQAAPHAARAGASRGWPAPTGWGRPRGAPDDAATGPRRRS